MKESDDARKKLKSECSLFGVAFFITCMLSLGFTIHRVTEDNPRMLAAKATITTKGDREIDRKGGKYVEYEHTYSYQCIFLDENGVKRTGIYEDSERYSWMDEQAYGGEGYIWNYTRGDVVDIYYAEDFEDGDVVSKSPDSHTIKEGYLWLLWGVTAVFFSCLCISWSDYRKLSK